MSATSIIERVRAAGGEITLADERIRLKVPATLCDEAVEEIKTHKGAIRLALKTEIDLPWDANDYRSFYDERAGIAEFDGGLPRAEAEAQAFGCCVAEWLNRNFVPSASGRCAACGGHQGPDSLLPFGTVRTGHVWLHSRCWPAWDDRRKAEAVLALSAMGITMPSSDRPYPEGDEGSPQVGLTAAAQRDNDGSYGGQPRVPNRRLPPSNPPLGVAERTTGPMRPKDVVK